MASSSSSRMTRPRHKMPKSIRQALNGRGLMRAYRARPAYQQNDYIGWITRAQRKETQDQRLAQMLDELERGDRYMKMVYRPKPTRSARMAARSTSGARVFRLEAPTQLELRNVAAKFLTFRGKRAVRLVQHYQPETEEDSIAIISESDFQDGVIETEIAGDVLPDAAAEMRGFVGIAFRVQPAGARFECFYLRPTNGRADDQLRRNHATQYISHPDYPWHRLRAENPGVYESYADLVPGAWTRIKIVVAGVRAELYVNDAEKPCLIVKDLKLGETPGKIALWIGLGTEAYFSRVAVKKQ